MKIYKNEGRKTSIKKMFKIVVVMAIILNISMPSFYNIVQAVIYPTSPYWTGKSELRYNQTDNSDAFPDSYKQYIKNLKITHPNWVFKAVYTNLDWTNSIVQESYDTNKGISTVPMSYSTNWKANINEPYKDGSFITASKKAVEYAMDPRNYLNDTSIFQFEALNFNEETSINSTIEKVISGTTMSSYPTQYKKGNQWVTLEGGLTWTQTIVNSAKNAGGTGISAVFLASRMKQETALEIVNNGSINGSNTIYPGIYNFFNIKAIPNSDGSGSVTNGLAYASNPLNKSGVKILNKDGSFGWTNPKYSIEAGATFLWSNYIQWGQNTVYFQKFDVSNLEDNASYLYGSQYMTNILAPSSESKITYNAYLNAGLINSNFVFHIPVYNNMPDTISPHPDSEFTESIITGTDIVYLDDQNDSNNPDCFNVRSGPGTEYSIISQINESSIGDANREKFIRISIGTGSNAYDKIRLNDGREGYVFHPNVKEYVYTHITGIALNKTATNLKVGGTETLTATISPTNAYIKNIIWNSSNSNVATVDSTGKITAKSIGTVNITATTLDGSKVATCTVTVGNTVATDISANSEYTLIVGNYLQIEPKIEPSTVTDKSYDITITDPTIAIVENGKIKGLKVGNTTVTLKTKDGSNKTFNFNLKVSTTVATVNTYTVDNTNTITKVALGTASSTFKENIVTTYTKKIVNASGTTLNDTDKVGTGTKIQILDGTNVIQEYTILIYGDISGDSAIDVVDLLMLKRKLTNKLVLGEYANKAANISKTGEEPDVTDLLRLKRHLTNKSLIVQ